MKDHATPPGLTGERAGRAQQTTSQQAQFIFEEWDWRARNLDVPGLLDLYTEDAVLESRSCPASFTGPGVPSRQARTGALLHQSHDGGASPPAGDEIGVAALA